jgi:thioredoxin-dependent peroxiredoxin
VAAQAKFKAKYNLPFPLLADTDSAVCDAFGVIVEKNMYGKKSMGIQRSTFLIDAGGKIVKIWPKVSVAGHAQEVLKSA